MFFFPGADGVRDLTVTGVQTCALPILLGFGVSSGDNVNIMECRNSHSYGAIDQLLPGEYTIRARVEQNILSPGLYLLNVGARCESKFLDYLPQVMTFEIYSDETVGSLWLSDVRGCVRVQSDWTQPQPLCLNSPLSFSPGFSPVQEQ